MFRCPTCIAVLPEPLARRCPACGQNLRRRPPRLLGSASPQVWATPTLRSRSVALPSLPRAAPSEARRSPADDLVTTRPGPAPEPGAGPAPEEPAAAHTYEPVGVASPMATAPYEPGLSGAPQVAVVAPAVLPAAPVVPPAPVPVVPPAPAAEAPVASPPPQAEPDPSHEAGRNGKGRRAAPADDERIDGPFLTDLRRAWDPPDPALQASYSRRHRWWHGVREWLG